MKVWKLVLLLLLSIGHIQCGCPCVEGGTCQIPYGRHPLDILYFGIHPHCEDVRKVRCCDRSGIRAYFVENEEDLFHPKLTPKVEHTRECGCIPKGACQPLNVVPDPTCSGSFEKCCLPRNQLVQLSTNRAQRRPKTIVNKPTPVYDPYASKTRSKKEIMFDSIVSCVPIQECEHPFEDDNHVWKELGITEGCPQDDFVRCVHNDTHVSNPFPEDREIEDILKTFGIAPQAPGVHLDPDGTLVIHGGSPIVVVDAADPTAQEPLILTDDHNAHPSQLEYFHHVHDNGTFVPNFDRIAQILDALSANESQPYEEIEALDYEETPASENESDDEFFDDVFSKLFGAKDIAETTLQPFVESETEPHQTEYYEELQTEPYLENQTEYYEELQAEPYLENQTEYYEEHRTEPYEEHKTYESLAADFHTEPHLESPLDPIDYEVVNYVEEIQELLKSDEASRQENQEVVEEFVDKIKAIIYFILEKEDTQILLRRDNDDKTQRYDVSKGNALELLNILNSFQRNRK